MSTQDSSFQLPFTCLILSIGLTIAHKRRTLNCNVDSVVKEIIDHIDHIAFSILVYQIYNSKFCPLFIKIKNKFCQNQIYERNQDLIAHLTMLLSSRSTPALRTP